MKRQLIIFALLTFFVLAIQGQTVTDIDGNVYDTVHIGSQIWLKENLKVTHYRNGDPIPNVTNNTTWGNLTTGAYCDYNNTPSISATYGKLYNWYTVNDSRNLCPIAWHVPTDAEWTTLTSYLGGENVAGGKLKETDTTHWNPPNTGATNETGFTALPAGSRNYIGGFQGIGIFGYWWSSTEEISSVSAWERSMLFNDIAVNRNDYVIESGFSVRCIMDSATQINNLYYNNKILIFPNPANDKVTVVFSEIHDVQLQVFNIFGKCIMETVLSKNKNDIDISSLSKGLYIIKITSANWTIQQKIIKE